MRTETVFQGLCRLRLQRAARIRAKHQRRHRELNEWLRSIVGEQAAPLSRMPEHGQRWAP